MATIIDQHLFSWNEVDASSDLDRLLLTLEHLPDTPIVEHLEALRGRGRDTYPVRAMWNAVIAGIVFQHPSTESLLRELKRNAELRQVCGFNPILGADAVPSSWAMSRFLGNVIRSEHLIRQMFSDCVSQLEKLLPDLGDQLAFDGKALPSFSTGVRNRKTGHASDIDADWGTKSYSGVKADGSAWSKITRWFGFQLHLIVDSKHELPVAYEVCRASTNESSRLLPMVDDLAATHPDLIERCSSLSADRGLDSIAINTGLWQHHRIKPIIDTRKLWKQEKDEQGFVPGSEITRPLDPSIVDTVVFSERGHVCCVCPETGTARPMAFWGFEESRSSVKYRCPAAAKNAVCPGRAACEEGASSSPGNFGRVVRIPLSTDPRAFTPIPRDSPTWRKLYSARTAVERVNARIDEGYGFERHTIRGIAKMTARIGLACAIMLALAIGHLEAGRDDHIRSLVGPRQPQRAA